MNKAQGIATHGQPSLITQRALALLNEGKVFAVFFDSSNTLAASRNEFERYAARTAKEVERSNVFKVDVSAQYIEEIFFGKVGSRTRLKRAWHFKVASFIFSSYYSHREEGLG